MSSPSFLDCAYLVIKNATSFKADENHLRYDVKIALLQTQPLFNQQSEIDQQSIINMILNIVSSDLST